MIVKKTTKYVDMKKIRPGALVVLTYSTSLFAPESRNYVDITMGSLLMYVVSVNKDKKFFHYFLYNHTLLCWEVNVVIKTTTWIKEL